MPLTTLIGGAMEYNLGMMSARPEGPRVGEGYLARGQRAVSLPATGYEGHCNL